MTTREILTLQFGHYSNYVGAHFWNIQELSFDYTGVVKTEVNHDILYREGRTCNGEVTYTPRLLIADLKGSLKTVPASGGLPVETESACCVWDNVETIQEQPAQKNEYLADLGAEEPPKEEKQYNLDQDVSTWTDYLYPRLHSRSINIVNEYQHGNENESFEIFNSGQHLCKHLDYGDTFCDNIRKYVEECDSIQGFQVNFDCTDGFAGLALGCIEHLADEYTKSILAYPIIPSYFSDNNPSTEDEREKATLKDSTRLVNIALSVEQLSEHATFFVPLCTGERGWRKPGKPRTFEYVDYNPELYYHSAAILASAMDTLGQKVRQKNNIYTLSDLCADMTGYGRKMAAASLGLPLSFSESNYLIEYLNTTKKPIYSSITPSCKIATDKIFQLVTIKGIPETYLKAQGGKVAKDQMNIPAYRCNTVKEMFELYFQANNFLSATNVTTCEKPLELKTPFPQIFSNTLNKYGFVKADDRVEKIESCATIAGYHNGTFMSDMIEKLHREVSRIKFAKLHKFEGEGLEAGDYQESLNRLSEFKDNYEDDFEL